MKKINEENLTYLDITDENWLAKLINIFLQNRQAIVKVKEDCYITYDSFINHIVNGDYLYKTTTEVYYYQKHISKVQSNLWKSTMIDLDRWKCLYSNNDKVIKYLRSIKPKKVYVIGEFSRELYNYINVYGNEFQTIILPNIYESYTTFINDPNSILIDTNNIHPCIKKKIYIEAKTPTNDDSKIIDINDLCDEAEIYYFITEILENAKYDVTIFEFPDSSQFSNLTQEEKDRINSNLNYIYYLNEAANNPKINELLKKVLKELYNEEYVNKENLSPGTILKNGICCLSDSDNDFCRSINGIRYTTDKKDEYAFDIDIFGPCMVYGALVDDKHTISSYLQRKINFEGKDYSVNNYGLRAMSLAEQIRILESVNVKQGDKLIFVISSGEKEKMKNYGYDKVISLLPVFNNSDIHDYFIDKPAHCNHIANSLMSDFIYEQIKHNLLDKNPVNKEFAKPIEKSKKRNVFSNNLFLEEYLNMLRNLEIPKGPNGAILMNCNPFTYGHYRLIEYAAKQVEKLFVIVVEDDKSAFTFEDRFKMVKDGCKDFGNVDVIPSGKIFGSSMIFPEYFNRSEKTNVTIDVSLDREIFTDYIAPTLHIKKRFIGEEKNDIVTSAYNRELKNNLPLYGIEVIEIPRFVDKDNNPISAKVLRKALDEGDWNKVEEIAPPSTIEVISKYKKSSDDKTLTLKRN